MVEVEAFPLTGIIGPRQVLGIQFNHTKHGQRVVIIRTERRIAKFALIKPSVSPLAHPMARDRGFVEYIAIIRHFQHLTFFLLVSAES